MNLDAEEQKVYDQLAHEWQTREAYAPHPTLVRVLEIIARKHVEVQRELAKTVEQLISQTFIKHVDAQHAYSSKGADLDAIAERIGPPNNGWVPSLFRYKALLEVHRLTEGLKAIVRAHCGCPYKDGNCVCEIAQTLLGDAALEEVYAEPAFHTEEGKYRVIPGPARRESVWLVVQSKRVGEHIKESAVGVYATKALAQEMLDRQGDDAKVGDVELAHFLEERQLES